MSRSQKWIAAAIAVFVIASMVGMPAVAATTSNNSNSSSVGQGPTIITDDITSDTTWTPSEGPYRVAQPITIRDGATLTIAAGTDVQFVDNAGISIAGELDVNGAVGDRVTFGPVEEGNGWNGLSVSRDVEGRVQVSVSHASVRNADTFMYAIGEASVSFTDVSVVGGERGILVHRDNVAGVRVVNSSFSGQAVPIQYGEKTPLGGEAPSVHNVTVTRSRFTDVGRAAIKLRAKGEIANVELRRNTVRGSNVTGILVRSDTKVADTAVTQNVMVNNRRGVVVVAQDGSMTGAVEMRNVRVVGNQLRGNRVVGLRLVSWGGAVSNASENEVRRNIVTDSETGVVFFTAANVTENAIAHNTVGVDMPVDDFDNFDNPIAIHRNNIYVRVYPEDATAGTA